MEISDNLIYFREDGGETVPVRKTDLMILIMRRFGNPKFTGFPLPEGVRPRAWWAVGIIKTEDGNYKAVTDPGIDPEISDEELESLKKDLEGSGFRTRKIDDGDTWAIVSGDPSLEEDIKDSKKMLKFLIGLGDDII